jgi:hypothetical protein
MAVTMPIQRAIGGEITRTNAEDAEDAEVRGGQRGRHIITLFLCVPLFPPFLCVSSSFWEVSETPPGRTLCGTSGRSSSQALRLLRPRVLTHEGIVLEHHIREGRFQRFLSLIAGLSSILAGYEVMTEHVQGSYGQRIMYSPVFLSPLLAIAGVWATFNRRVARTFLPIISAILMLDGLVGFLYHVRGISRKPGGWRLPVFNIAKGPPLFAPLLFGLSGFLGFLAAFLRREDDPMPALPPGMPHPFRRHVPSFLPQGITREGIILEQDIREGRFQRGLAIATAVSAFLNGMESLYSHYRDGYIYRVQWTPVLLAPVVTVVGIAAVVSKKIAHTLLPAVSLLAILDGSVGFFFHLRGISRLPTSPKQMVHSLVYGPPIFAPLLFAATGFLGLLASLMRREKL